MSIFSILLVAVGGVNQQQPVPSISLKWEKSSSSRRSFGGPLAGAPVDSTTTRTHWNSNET
jgi:hypothetical protein